MTKTKRSGYILILLSAVCFASYGVWAKEIASTYQIFTQAWTRALIISVTLFVIGYFAKQFRRFEKQDTKWIVSYNLLTIFTVAPIFYAFTHMAIGTAAMMFYAAYMITSYLVGVLLFGEKFTVAKSVATVLALVGLGLVYGVELGGASALAMLAAIANGVASGGEVTLTKKISNKYSVVQLTFVSWVFIFVVHFIAAVASHETLFPKLTAASGFSMVAFAMMAMIGFWLAVAGYKQVEASIAGLIGTLEVPFAVALGFTILHQHVAGGAIFGGLLIFLAAGLPDIVSLVRHQRQKEPVPPERDLA